MVDIQRYKSRLKNIGKNTQEFRMTREEAFGLLGAIEELEQKLAEKPKEIVVYKDPVPTSRILDGGTF